MRKAEKKVIGQETLTFFRELPQRFSQIGMVMPSSPSLARSMVRPIKRASQPVAILEVGPGTGPVTKQILKNMGPEDSLLVCEINRAFLKSLKKRLARNPDFCFHRKRVRFFLGPVQELAKRNLKGKFDVIVSSLPFSNFTPELVEEILCLYQELLSDKGTLTFYEYLGMRKIGALIQPEHERERIKAVDQVVKRWRERFEGTGRLKKELTFLNIPPAMTLEANYGDASPEVSRRELFRIPRQFTLHRLNLRHGAQRTS